MATGDIGNNAAKVRKQLHAIHYPHDVPTSIENLTRGEPHDHLAELLRILHYGLLDHSRHVAQLVQDAGFDLYGKTDLKFVDGVFRLAREKFSYFPLLTTAQFLSPHHFRERKLIILNDILAHAAQVHANASRKQRQEHAVWVPPTTKPSTKPSVRVPSNHVMTAEVDDEHSPWTSLNLGKAMATPSARVIRHERQRQPTTVVSSDLNRPSNQTIEEPPILDWTTKIDGATYHAVDKSILDASRPIDPHDQWWNQSPHAHGESNQEDGAHEYMDDDHEEDMYPRGCFTMQPTQAVDVAPVPQSPAAVTPPPPLDMFRAELTTLEANLFAKLDAMMDMVSAKFSALDIRLASLEDCMANRPSPVVDPPRPKLSTFLTNSTNPSYRWPPEPSVFGKQQS
ncbi:Aste57867_4079 [Aphanomyces stellatus]|uniref:Centrosomal protein of 44 kDa n=1 Tax=Aphanomyces stellatus TaxID=120398 RepID=A0A485KFC2_9STRA|nr:hypothetical protein As57867_004068 [Aphanomyces stellatus]VFT81213.1 Aste57867_4079 [Aphanomyces stellatus]